MENDMRHKVRINWLGLLKADETSIEFGINKRLFRQSELYRDYVSGWDYPERSYGWTTRSWKKYRKTQYKAK